MRALPGSFSFFSAFFMVCTACSASPLAYDSFWLDVTCVNEYSFENSSNSVETNFGALSDLRILVFRVWLIWTLMRVLLDFWDASSIDISMKRE